MLIGLWASELCLYWLAGDCDWSWQPREQALCVGKVRLRITSSLLRTTGLPQYHRYVSLDLVNLALYRSALPCSSALVNL